MRNTIIDSINKDPIWSFSKLVNLEGGECMQLTLDCTLHAEVIDSQLILLVNPLDPMQLSEFNLSKLETAVKQEVWDKFGAIPSVVFFSIDKGFF
jgi:hypothetical protein